MIKQAVLLAAGTGTRLMPLTADRPKCMVEVDGCAIVDTLLAALLRLGIEKIVVVTGYQADTLEDYLRKRDAFRWHFIHNERYATTNNILSLQVAAEAIVAPFLLVESDIYLAPEVLAPLHEPDRILVAPYTPQMDGTGITMDQKGHVAEMVIRAHQSRANSLGTMHKTVNFYSFSETTWGPYRAALNRWVAKGRLDQYYEAVLAELINDGVVQMKGVDVGLEGWAEVDNADDLRHLERQLQRNSANR